MSRVLLFFTLTMAALSAHAYDYGRWMCNSCVLYPILLSTTSQTPAPVEVLEFIRHENPAIMATKLQPIDRWVPGDIIIVCDGTLCLKVTYFAVGNWFPMAPGTTRDNGQGYKNASLNLQNGHVGERVAVFDMNFIYTDYSQTKPYSRKWKIIVGPLVPKQDIGLDYSIGPDFSLGFEWGSATSSDAAGSASVCRDSSCGGDWQAY